MKVAFVFPGQGSQYVSMGRSLWENFDVVKKIYQLAEDITKKPIRKLSFEGPDAELTKTSNAQVAILVHSISAYEIIKDRLKPALVFGHSLGEFSALYCAGILSLEDVIEIVAKRGELMEQAAKKHKGTMAAIIGLPLEKIEEVLKEVNGIVVVANINSTSQIVISGEEEAVSKAMSLLKKEGAKRVVPLNVAGAFHSPLMKESANEFAKFLDNFNFKKPKVPVIPNVLGKITTDENEIKNALKKQMTGSVKFVDTLFEAKNYGIDTFIEFGPRRVLCGLIAKTLKGVNLYGVDTKEDFDNFPF